MSKELFSERLQLKLTKDLMADVERVVERAEFRGKADLFDNAFVLFCWALDRVEEGKRIAAVDEAGGTLEYVTMPAFASVARKNGDED